MQMGGYAVFVRGQVDPVAWFENPDKAYMWARDHYATTYKINYVVMDMQVKASTASDAKPYVGGRATHGR